MSRVRKIYNLRKTSNLKPPPTPSQQSPHAEELSSSPAHAIEVVQQRHSSRSPPPGLPIQPPETYEVDDQQLHIDQLQLQFRAKVGDIQRKEVSIKNVGCSAIYVDLQVKNQGKVNENGFKDTQPKFHCHYHTNVIRPHEEKTFTFSFFSSFPGSFTDSVVITTQPPIRTPIPNLVLAGTATTTDPLSSKRDSLADQIRAQILHQEVSQLLSDVVDRVKLPPPPPPDVSQPEVAEREFERQNKDKKLYYSETVVDWMKELYDQICNKQQVPEDKRYWDHSVNTLYQLIQSSQVLDDVERKCMRERLEHYSYLATSAPPRKSHLYNSVYSILSDAAYHLGGDYVDAVRKEMDLWQIPFQEPLETDTEEEIKTRKEEADKIKADWAKKAKKKKWGEEEERELTNEFKSKVQAKTTEHVLDAFSGFDEKADFIRAGEEIKNQSDTLEQHHRFLKRIKTVRECSLEGKKVLVKWNLQLKPNCEEQLVQLQEYLVRKQQEAKRLEEEKKNEGAKKKKTVKPKKKGQKEEEQKPIVFDFMSILDEQNWQGLTQTLRLVLDKQPYLVLVGVTYGPRTGAPQHQYSVQFLLELLKAIEPSVDFFPHQNLPSLVERIQTEAIAEGSLLLMENLNFLPQQTTVETITQPSEQEGQPPVQSSRKLLHPQIREFFDSLGEGLEVIVSQDRYLSQNSGFTAYSNRGVILGSQWWKYVGLSTRVIGSTVIFGDQFDANRLKILHRLTRNVQKIYLTGEVGAKFLLVHQKQAAFANLAIGSAQKNSIQHFFKDLETEGLTEKVVIPEDWVVRPKKGEAEEEPQPEARVWKRGEELQFGEVEVIDIGPASRERLSVSEGHLFVLGQTAVKSQQDKCSQSYQELLRKLYQYQVNKVERHNAQSATPSGINYNEDLVIYLVGGPQQAIEGVTLKPEKQSEGDEEDNAGGEEEEDSDKKKIDQVCDYHLASRSSLEQLWSGQFDYGLKDAVLYPELHDD